MCAHQSWYKKVGWKMVPNSEEQPFPKHKTLWLLWVWVKSVAVFSWEVRTNACCTDSFRNTRENNQHFYSMRISRTRGCWGIKPISLNCTIILLWYTPSSTCWRWDDHGMKQHHSQLLKPAASIKQPEIGEGMLKQILFGAARYHHMY